MRNFAILPLMFIAPMGGDVPACAAPPRLVVNGPTTGVPGEILTYDFGQSEGDNLKFRVVAEPQIVGYKHVFHDAPTATKANVAGFPGTYRIRIQAFNAEGIDEWERILTVPGNPPCPQPPPKPIDPPSPVPGPTPTPVPVPVPTPDVVPVGEFNISPKVADIIKRIGPATTAAALKQLAESLDAIAAQVAAGTLTGVNDLLTKIGEAVKATGVAALQAAAAELSKEIAAVYEKHKRDRLAVSTLGGFKEPSGWAALIREIAVGVRAGGK